LGIEEDCIGTQGHHQTIALVEGVGEKEEENNKSCLNIGNPSAE
jgi:hypothetical protein